MKKIILLITFLFFILPINTKALTINLFYGAECPHCEEERAYLDTLKKQYGDNIDLKLYEVWHNDKNNELLLDVRQTLGDSNEGVPYTVIGTHDFTGYSERIAGEIRNLIIQSIAKPIPDVINDIKTGKEIQNNSKEINNTITVPILGEINPQDVSLPLLATTLGFSDSFNPCSIWVLLFFISLMLGIRNKKNLLMTGITYIIITSITYALFIITWMHIPNTELPQAILRSVIAIIAIITGALNLRYFLRYGSEKPEKTSQRLSSINKIINNHKFIFSLILTILLMIFINLIELAASSGSPLLFTSVLALNDIHGFSYFINILLYVFFFILDDIIIFVILLKIMKKINTKSQYQKYASLIGGILLLILATALIFKPDLFMFNF